jgi:hypothetical protein
MAMKERQAREPWNQGTLQAYKRYTALPKSILFFFFVLPVFGKSEAISALAHAQRKKEKGKCFVSLHRRLWTLFQ